MQATSIRDELKDAQRQSTAFLYIFEGFMGLGLIVGVAAIGVIAFRSVVERRQQIGVLRAIGYPALAGHAQLHDRDRLRGGVGVLSGTVLGLMLARNLFSDEDFAASAATFVMPWTILVVIVIATITSALLMAWVPSRRAGQNRSGGGAAIRVGTRRLQGWSARIGGLTPPRPIPHRRRTRRA